MSVSIATKAQTKRGDFPSTPFLVEHGDAIYLAMKNKINYTRFDCVNLVTGEYINIALHLDSVLDVGEEVVLKQTS